MVDYRSIELQLLESLGLRRRPVAVKFQEAPPAGVSKFAGTEPSGCSFWRLAADGRVFYTVGTHTHNIPLPENRTNELNQVLSIMTSIGYIKTEEVQGIARLPQTPGVVVYAPLGDAPVDPDVVIFAGAPGRLMLLQEAALRAGCAVRATPALEGGAIACTRIWATMSFTSPFGAKISRKSPRKSRPSLLPTRNCWLITDLAAPTWPRFRELISVFLPDSPSESSIFGWKAFNVPIFKPFRRSGGEAK